uniref:Hyphally regulated cell wall protein 1-like n=1 Tax=Loa loa TaxID=7209 RepID=A0A1I7VE35_LOALO
MNDNRRHHRCRCRRRRHRHRQRRCVVSSSQSLVGGGWDLDDGVEEEREDMVSLLRFRFSLLVLWRIFEILCCFLSMLAQVKLATNLIAFRGVFRRSSNTQHQQQPEQSVRITQPQKVPHQSHQLQQGATVGGNSRNSSNNSNSNNTNTSSGGGGGGGGGGGAGGGGGGGGNSSVGRSSFSSSSSGNETPTTSSTSTATSNIGYSGCIMYDQHPSIADSYSLVIATSTDANNTSNGGATIGKIDNNIETQLS